MHTLFDLVLATPEIVLLVLTSLVLLLDAFDRESTRHMTFMLTMAALVIVILVSWGQWSDDVHGRTFSGLYVADSLGHFLKILSALAVGVTLIYGRSYAEKRDMTTRGGELYSLTLLMLLGEFVMISAGSMLTVYLGVELMSFALYALVALRRDHFASTEAAMKYYVLGCLASGILLYGMSMIYGATGQVGLAEIAQVIRSGQAQSLPLAFGVVFIVAGLGFKLTAAPFHMWTPDVYQGAPTTVTLLVGALLEGVPESALEEVFTQRLRLNPGAETLIQTVQQHGLKVVLVSGGFTFFTERLRRGLMLDEAHANTLEVAGGRLTGRVLGEIVDGAAKARHVKAAAAALGAAPEQIIVLGDGSNDLPMMALAHYSVAYRAKPVVRAQARFALDVSPLDAVLNWFRRQH
ncbi:NAD(P)H-quinone oxidoreductase subunit 2, chloroplastic [Castellaniella defragrans]